MNYLIIYHPGIYSASGSLPDPHMKMDCTAPLLYDSHSMVAACLKIIEQKFACMAVKEWALMLLTYVPCPLMCPLYDIDLALV